MEIHFNPANESRRVLLALAAMLTTLAGSESVSGADRPDVGTDNVVLGPTIREMIKAGVLPPVSGGTADLAAAFGGAGNGAASSGTASSPPPVANAASSPTIPTPISVPAAASPGPDLAAAFGGNSALPNGVPGVPAPNAAPAPPANLPPPGTPPVPGNGAATAGGSTLDLDTDGLPWHSDIHSSNKKKSATGKWMARRNVSPVTLARVTAELRAALSVGNAPAPASAAPPPPTPTPIPLPGTTPAPAGSSSITLPTLLPRITAAMAAGQLTADATAGIAMELSGGQINNVAMLAIAPHLVPAFWDRLDQLGVAR